jgi:hypothetical protein
VEEGVVDGKVKVCCRLYRSRHRLDPSLRSYSHLLHQQHVVLLVMTNQHLSHQPTKQLRNCNRPDPASLLLQDRHPRCKHELPARSLVLGHLTGVEEDELAEMLVLESDGKERLGPAREASCSVDFDGAERGGDVVNRGGSVLDGEWAG